ANKGKSKKVKVKRDKAKSIFTFLIKIWFLPHFCLLPFTFCLSFASSFATTEHIKPHSEAQNRTLRYVLHVIFNSGHRHSVIQTRHEERSKTCAEDSAAPAHQTRPTDDARRNSVQFQKRST